MIKEIIVDNCKGITHKDFKFDIFPNKFSIFVAPNGFGKTSIAHIFSDLHRDKLALPDCDLPNNNNNPPCLEIIDNEGHYVANMEKNEINKKYATYVINSKLIAKGKGRYIDSNIISQDVLSVHPITIMNNVPPKAQLTYSKSDIKKYFGKNGKILKNIDSILKNKRLLYDVGNIKLEKKDYLYIKSIIEFINTINGNVTDIETSLSGHYVLSSFSKNLQNLFYIFERNGITDDIDKLLCACIICIIHEDPNYTHFLKYNSYLYSYEYYKNLIKELNTTPYDIKLNKKDKELQVTFPSPENISNGQRDILTFIADLISAKKKLTKKDKAILIIDEIFDYLDAGNLIVLQYYIANLVKAFKSENKELYPILLTHLDPYFFKHFLLSNMKVYFLDGTPANCNKSPITNMIKERNNKQLKEILSKYYFHFDPEFSKQDFSTIFIQENFPAEWGNPKTFFANCLKDLIEYIKPDSSNYNCFKISISLRFMIEAIIFYKISSLDDKDCFINTHETLKKLDFAKEKNIEIPEHYYILGIIYNESLHINNNQNIGDALYSKLKNKVVKKIISDVYNDFINAKLDKLIKS